MVEETPGGFDVRLALEDPQWFGTFREWRLVTSTVHHVRTDDARRTCSVEDDLRTITWRAGADGRERPTFAASRSVERGRVVRRSVQKTYTIGGDGVRQESERRSDSTVGRRLVEDAAAQLGWRQERSTSEKVGLYVGVGTLALLVLAGLVVGVVALAGGFS